MKKRILLLLAVSCFACKKNTDITNVNTGGTNGSQGVSNLPGIDIVIPLTKGNFWKYQRIDTGYVSIPPYYRSDTSIELVTYTGDTMIRTIDPVNKLYILEVKNLTKGTVDTNYMAISNDAIFTIYGQWATMYDGFYQTGPLIDFNNIRTTPAISTDWKKYISLPSRVTNSPFNLDTLRSKPDYTISLDTVYTRIDTSISLPINTFTKCIYANYTSMHRSFAASGAGGYFYQYSAFIKPGLGFVFVKQYPYLIQSSAFMTFRLSSWFTRRLIDSKIQ